ncbi:MAG: SPASM domain-containing protein [Bacteroidota bacterium]
MAFVAFKIQTLKSKIKSKTTRYWTPALYKKKRRKCKDSQALKNEVIIVNYKELNGNWYLNTIRTEIEFDYVFSKFYIHQKEQPRITYKINREFLVNHVKTESITEITEIAEKDNFPNSIYSVLCDHDLDYNPVFWKKYKEVLKKVKEIAEILYSFDFKIEKEQDVEIFENAINQLNIENNAFHPYYNGNNIELFEQAVYLNKEDIFEAKPTQKDIFARQVINQLNFGKLYILPDASVYSNLNKPKLGNLNKHSIHELVHKEMYKHKNWFKLRKNVKPCRSCVYSLLCPSISNYEYAIGKYNLCHVWEEN